MNVPALLATILLIASVATYGVLTWASKQNEAAPEAAPMATTTEAAATSTPTTTPAVKEPTTKPETVYQPVYIPTPEPKPTIEITNGVRNEGSGTVNVYNPPPAATTPPPTTAPPFVEPRTYTPLEIATEIVQLYDPNGIAEYWGDGQSRIRVTAFGGKTVTIDVTGDWQEKLKLTLNKIK